MHNYYLANGEGICGPEILLNVDSGVGCFRFDDGRIAGVVPQEPITNAFVIWVGVYVVVTSAGVDADHVPQVAAGLRSLLGAQDVPVAIKLASPKRAGVARLLVDGGSPVSRRQIARAEAYAQLQAGLADGGRLQVEVDGRLYELETGFAKRDDGTYIPTVE
jgi:hypothetical protein